MAPGGSGFLKNRTKIFLIELCAEGLPMTENSTEVFLLLRLIFRLEKCLGCFYPAYVVLHGTYLKFGISPLRDRLKLMGIPDREICNGTTDYYFEC